MPRAVIYPSPIGEMCLECLENLSKYSLKADTTLRGMAKKYWLYYHPILNNMR